MNTKIEGGDTDMKRSQRNGLKRTIHIAKDMYAMYEHGDAVCKEDGYADRIMRFARIQSDVNESYDYDRYDVSEVVSHYSYEIEEW